MNIPPLVLITAFHHDVFFGSFICIPHSAGVTTGCVVNADNIDTFVVSANVSGSLSQCESWGVTVSGGFPPYIVMLAETNSPVVTNSTPLAVGGIIFPKRVNLGGSLVGVCIRHMCTQ